MVIKIIIPGLVLFSLEGDGYLTYGSNGYYVQGWQVNEDGTINTNTKNLDNIHLDRSMDPSATTSFDFTGNIYSKSDSKVTISADIYDSQGSSHTVTFYLEKTADNTWQINSDEIQVTDGSNISIGSDTFTLKFDDDGNLVNGKEIKLSFTPEGMSTTQTVSIDLSAINQIDDDTDVKYENDDGHPAGSLESFSFSESGVLVGKYDNGYYKPIAQLAIGNFSNSSGLVKVGDTLYEESSNSGNAIICAAGSSGTGAVKEKSLEASNVDLSEQFTDMIKIQRGYQANSSVVTTSDEMLETLINMKR